MEITKAEKPKTPSDISTLVIIPSFMISELSTAFKIGFIIYLPFLIIDMVVASVFNVHGNDDASSCYYLLAL